MKLTLILALLCIAGFALGIYGGEDFYNAFGFSLNNLQSNPSVLVTSIFMHGSIEHLLSNVFVLLFFGLAVEAELGKRKMLLIFFLGAFAGDLLSLAVYAPDQIAIGASAGIFALVGVGMLVRPLDLSFYPLVMPILCTLQCLWFCGQPGSGGQLYSALWRTLCWTCFWLAPGRLEKRAQDNSCYVPGYDIDTGCMDAD